MNLRPNFVDRDSYLGWMQTWKATYNRLTADIQKQRATLKSLQRGSLEEASKAQKALHYNRRTAFKMMTLREEAVLRRDRILTMQKDIAAQNATFPLTLDTRVVDIHFNKVSNEFSFMPMWTVKAQGKSYYVPHVDAQMGFSTRELDQGSTRGMLRFRNATLSISKDGEAKLTPRIAA